MRIYTGLEAEAAALDFKRHLDKSEALLDFLYDYDPKQAIFHVYMSTREPGKEGIQTLEYSGAKVIIRDALRIMERMGTLERNTYLRLIEDMEFMENIYESQV